MSSDKMRFVSVESPESFLWRSYSNVSVEPAGNRPGRGPRQLAPSPRTSIQGHQILFSPETYVLGQGLPRITHELLGSEDSDSHHRAACWSAPAPITHALVCTQADTRLLGREVDFSCLGMHLRYFSGLDCHLKGQVLR